MEKSISNDIKKINDSINRRGFFRFYSTRDLCANMGIYSIDGSVIKGKSVKVCIDNISAGGMSFLTNLDLPLPVNDNYTLYIEFKLLGIDFTMESVVVRKELKDKFDLIEYGVTFFCSDIMRKDLVKVINTLSVNVKKSKVDYASCSLCTQKLERGCFR